MTLPSLGSRLAGAQEKVRRANQQINAFRPTLKRFRKRDPYTAGAEQFHSKVALPSGYRKITRIDPTTVIDEPFTTSVDLTITLTPKPDIPAPTLRWGVMLGEIVHNLGSALDNLVWELAESCKATWPSPPLPTGIAKNDREALWRYNNRKLGIGFPYTKERKGWVSNLDRYLYFVPDADIRTVLEEAQPFYAWEQFGKDPEYHPLWVLHELWNRDKHYTVNLAPAGLEYGFANVRIPELFGPNTYLPSEIIKSFPLRPIEGKTEIAIIRVRLPQPVKGGKPYVYVEPTLALTILFGKGAPSEGEGALDKLTAAKECIIDLFKKFA